MSITAIVQNDTIKLPMHVPDGTRVEIMLPEKDQKQNLPVGDLNEFSGVLRLHEDPLEWQRRSREEWR